MTLTWDIVENVTVINSGIGAKNNLTTQTYQGARVNNAAAQGSGKFYFEMEFASVLGGGNVSAGVGAIGTTFTDLGNGVWNCAAVYFSGIVWSLGANTTKTIGAITSGNIIGVAADLTNRKIWFRKSPSGNWNGAAIGSENPATNTGGVALPAVGLLSPYCTFGGTSGVANNTINSCFGPDSAGVGLAWSGTPPVGFSRWPDIVSTLYSETVKNGYAKLLAVSEISTPVASVNMSCNFAGFDSYFYDLDQLMLSVHGALVRLQVSANAGSTWVTTGMWWSLHTMWASPPSGGPYRDYGSAALGAGFDAAIQIGHGEYAANAFNGRVRIHPNTSTCNILFRTTGVQDSYFDQINWGSGFASAQGSINMLRFITSSGNFNSGAIRCYGMRTGA